MLHVLSEGPSSSGAGALRGMFEARKRIFVDLLGWDVPVLAGRYEVDQFDDVHCTYLVLTDRTGRHLASARLLPTTRPHILDSLYPDLCDGPIPRGPGIFEITRFCLERELTARERRRARDTLICGLIDHARTDGITAYTAIAEQRWLAQIRCFGWRTRLLGGETDVGLGRLGALEIRIEPDTLAQVNAAGLIPDEALVRMPDEAVS